MEPHPALLISYAYWKDWEPLHERYVFRHWVLDSGAFTAHSKGEPIDLAAFTEFALERQETDPLLQDVFGLDVIGDAEASMKNYAAMRDAGVRVIPTFHFGSDPSYLAELVRDYDKIALGGMVGNTMAKDKNKRGKTEKQKRAFIEQCFARAPAQKFHSFGIASRRLLLDFPFHSADCTNWMTRPTRFGKWEGYGNQYGKVSARIPVRGSGQMLRVQINHYLKLEDFARYRWSDIYGGEAPTVYLPVSTGGTKRYDTCFDRRGKENR